MWLVKIAIFLGIVIFFALRVTKKDKDGNLAPNFPWIATGATALLVALLFILPAFGTVDAGNRGVVLRFGGTTGKVLNPGAYFLVPFINSVEMMNVQTISHKVEAPAASKDLQDVATEVTVNFSLNQDYASKVYEEFRRDYSSRILDPAVLDAVKTATAHFNAEDLIAQRPAVKELIEKIIRERITPTHTLYALSITNFSFSKSFSDAIEAKVTATQAALEEQNKLAAVKFRAEQRIATATAEAEAIRIQAQAITQQGGAEYVNLKWVEKWNGQMPTVLTGEGSAFLMQLPSK